jgi:hypothetical protein
MSCFSKKPIPNQVLVGGEFQQFVTFDAAEDGGKKKLTYHIEGLNIAAAFPTSETNHPPQEPTDVDRAKSVKANTVRVFRYRTKKESRVVEIRHRYNTWYIFVDGVLIRVAEHRADVPDKFQIPVPFVVPVYSEEVMLSRDLRQGGNLDGLAKMKWRPGTLSDPWSRKWSYSLTINGIPVPATYSKFAEDVQKTSYIPDVMDFQQNCYRTEDIVMGNHEWLRINQAPEDRGQRGHIGDIQKKEFKAITFGNPEDATTDVERLHKFGDKVKRSYLLPEGAEGYAGDGESYNFKEMFKVAVNAGVKMGPDGDQALTEEGFRRDIWNQCTVTPKERFKTTRVWRFQLDGEIRGVEVAHEKEFWYWLVDGIEVKRVSHWGGAANYDNDPEANAAAVEAGQMTLTSKSQGSKKVFGCDFQIPRKWTIDDPNHPMVRASAMMQWSRSRFRYEYHLVVNNCYVPQCGFKGSPIAPTEFYVIRMVEVTEPKKLMIKDNRLVEKRSEAWLAIKDGPEEGNPNVPPEGQVQEPARTFPLEHPKSWKDLPWTEYKEYLRGENAQLLGIMPGIDNSMPFKTARTYLFTTEWNIRNVSVLHSASTWRIMIDGIPIPFRVVDKASRFLFDVKNKLSSGDPGIAPDTVPPRGERKGKTKFPAGDKQEGREVNPWRNSIQHSSSIWQAQNYVVEFFIPIRKMTREDEELSEQHQVPIREGWFKKGKDFNPEYQKNISDKLEDMLYGKLQMHWLVSANIGTPIEDRVTGWQYCLHVEDRTDADWYATYDKTDLKMSEITPLTTSSTSVGGKETVGPMRELIRVNDVGLRAHQEIPGFIVNAAEAILVRKYLPVQGTIVAGCRVEAIQVFDFLPDKGVKAKKGDSVTLQEKDGKLSITKGSESMGILLSEVSEYVEGRIDSGSSVKLKKDFCHGQKGDSGLLVDNGGKLEVLWDHRNFRSEIPQEQIATYLKVQGKEIYVEKSRYQEFLVGSIIKISGPSDADPSEYRVIDRIIVPDESEDGAKFILAEDMEYTHEIGATVQTVALMKEDWWRSEWMKPDRFWKQNMSDEVKAKYDAINAEAIKEERNHLGIGSAEDLIINIPVRQNELGIKVSEGSTYRQHSDVGKQWYEANEIYDFGDGAAFEYLTHSIKTKDKVVSVLLDGQPKSLQEINKADKDSIVTFKLRREAHDKRIDKEEIANGSRVERVEAIEEFPEARKGDCGKLAEDNGKLWITWDLVAERSEIKPHDIERCLKKEDLNLDLSVAFMQGQELGLKIEPGKEDGRGRKFDEIKEIVSRSAVHNYNHRKIKLKDEVVKVQFLGRTVETPAINVSGYPGQADCIVSLTLKRKDQQRLTAIREEEIKKCMIAQQDPKDGVGKQERERLDEEFRKNVLKDDMEDSAYAADVKYWTTKLKLDNVGDALVKKLLQAEEAAGRIPSCDDKRARKQKNQKEYANAEKEFDDAWRQFQDAMVLLQLQWVCQTKLRNSAQQTWGIGFQRGEAKLTTEAETAVKYDIAQILKLNPEFTMLIQGFTEKPLPDDIYRTPDQVKYLAIKRCIVIQNMLKKKGVMNLIGVEGIGFDEKGKVFRGRAEQWAPMQGDFKQERKPGCCIFDQIKRKRGQGLDDVLVWQSPQEQVDELEDAANQFIEYAEATAVDKRFWIETDNAREYFSTSFITSGMSNVMRSFPQFSGFSKLTAMAGIGVGSEADLINDGYYIANPKGPGIEDISEKRDKFKESKANEKDPSRNLKSSELPRPISKVIFKTSVRADGMVDFRLMFEDEMNYGTIILDQEYATYSRFSEVGFKAGDKVSVAGKEETFERLLDGQCVVEIEGKAMEKPISYVQGASPEAGIKPGTEVQVSHASEMKKAKFIKSLDGYCAVEDTDARIPISRIQRAGEEAGHSRSRLSIVPDMVKAFTQGNWLTGPHLAKHDNESGVMSNWKEDASSRWMSQPTNLRENLAYLAGYPKDNSNPMSNRLSKAPQTLESFSQQLKLEPCYELNDEVEYFSRKHKKWMAGIVTKIMRDAELQVYRWTAAGAEWARNAEQEYESKKQDENRHRIRKLTKFDPIPRMDDVVRPAHKAVIKEIYYAKKEMLTGEPDQALSEELAALEDFVAGRAGHSDNRQEKSERFFFLEEARCFYDVVLTRTRMKRQNVEIDQLRRPLVPLTLGGGSQAAPCKVEIYAKKSIDGREEGMWYPGEIDTREYAAATTGYDVNLIEVGCDQLTDFATESVGSQKKTDKKDRKRLPKVPGDRLRRRFEAGEEVEIYIDGRMGWVPARVAKEALWHGCAMRVTTVEKDTGSDLTKEEAVGQKKKIQRQSETAVRERQMGRVIDFPWISRNLNEVAIMRTDDKFYRDEANFPGPSAEAYERGNQFQEDAALAKEEIDKRNAAQNEKVKEAQDGAQGASMSEQQTEVDDDTETPEQLKSRRVVSMEPGCGAEPWSRVPIEFGYDALLKFGCVKLEIPNADFVATEWSQLGIKLCSDRPTIQEISEGAIKQWNETMQVKSLSLQQVKVGYRVIEANGITEAKAILEECKAGKNVKLKIAEDPAKFFSPKPTEDKIVGASGDTWDDARLQRIELWRIRPVPRSAPLAIANNDGV